MEMKIIIQIKTMILILDIFKTILVLLVGMILGYYKGKKESEVENNGNDD